MCSLVILALKHVTHHVFKHLYEAQTKGHESGGVLQCHTTNSCDSHDEFHLCIVNIVVALVDVYGERSLTWLPGVLQQRSSNFLTGIRRTVSLPDLVAVPCVVLELQVVFGVPTQQERGIVDATCTCICICVHVLDQCIYTHLISRHFILNQGSHIHMNGIHIRLQHSLA